MILGQLPIFKTLLTDEKKLITTKLIGKHIELKKLQVVQCYHVSNIKNRESILRYGLLPKEKVSNEVTYEPRIFVSTTYDEAAFDYVNYEYVDVWTFYIPQEILFPDEFSSFANHYYIQINVPWYKLSLLETIY